MAEKPLNERIRDALSAKDPDACRNLIAEAEAAAGAANEEHERLRQRALDPLVSDDELAAARKAMADALFDRERWQKAAESRPRQRRDLP
ncbi:hypothetical protein [Jiella pelagia]|uniref:Uncharacterized protein n=1 Tax=Jiella pelagia TaxID=2986949 RepID=A0ABY7C368_9HYPH|nr:hypothetical protein [Jiella pelagia]WAP69310.1 hypothetical protein OH818_03145 [Jiella pelagia]